jgi:ATP-dependent Clp protease protease subunit
VRQQRNRPGAGRRRGGLTLGSSDSDAKETDVNDLLGMDRGAPVARTDGPNFGLNDSIYNRLLRERIIWLGTEVRDENANAICAQMMLLAAEDPAKDIYLYINSPGGSITAGMAIYDTMQFIQPDVATVAMGMAASMGQFLLSSGAKGKRYATPHARVMMHQPSGGIGGTATDVRINAELIMHMKKTLAELTAEQTGQSLEKVLKDSDRDKWFTADQALEYGFVDHVVASASSVSGGGGTTAS